MAEAWTPQVDFAEEDEFLRRIPPWEYDHARRKLNSSAFRNDDEETKAFSVNCRRWATEAQTLNGFDGWGLAVLRTDQIRSEAQDVVHTPQETNYAHCDVVGEKTKTVRRNLRNMVDLIIVPVPQEGVEPTG